MHRDVLIVMIQIIHRDEYMVMIQILDEVIKVTILPQGSACRATGATAMNEQSSRSHAIFTVTIQQQNPDIE
jgi:predicted nucleic acid-binding protein